MISVIVALTNNGAIGRRGDLLFHISDDLRRFKSLTTGHPIIMGRKTFESFPKGPLPGRRNIVITRNGDWHHEGVETAPSLGEALKLAADNNPYIIGGGQIYDSALPLADRLCLTEIDTVCDDADTFFPEIKWDEWKETECSDYFTDQKSGVRYRFVTYDRK